jgi:hypothetical protein
MRYRTEPDVGLVPLEHWNGRNAHVGNEITEVTGPPPPPDMSIYRPTHTARLLDSFAREARGRGQLPGYQNGQVFDETGRIQPDLLDYLRPRLGNEVTDMLTYYSEARARSWSTPGLQGARNSATMLGRAIRDAREHGNFPAETRRDAEAMLTRLYETVRLDIADAALRAGDRGRAYVEAANRIDGAYRRYMREIRRPLARVLGENVDPVEAIGRLVAAARDGGDIGLLRAFYAAVDETGYGRAEATSLLLHDMLTRGGMRGFLTGYRALSDDARELMFGGAAREIGRHLNELARVGGRLERFARVAEEGYFTNPARWPRLGNLTLGLLYTISLPTLVKGVLTAEAASRMLSSRWFGRWLQGWPIENAPGSTAWTRHLNRLRALATAELGLDDRTGEALLQALMPGTARAEEGPTRNVAGKEGTHTGRRHRPETLTGEIIPPPPRERRRTVGKGSIQEIDDNGPFGRTGQHNLIPNAVRWLVGAGNRTLEDTSELADRFFRNDPTLTDQERQELFGSIGFGGTVIGRIGAQNLAAAGRPTAQRVLRQAERLDRQGLGIQVIRRRVNRIIAREDPRLGTVVRLPDGQWGLELSNELSTFSPPPRIPPGMEEGWRVRLTGSYDDPELAAAYPRFVRDTLISNHRRPFSEMTYDSNNRPLVRLGPRDDPHRSTVHEVEHGVQVIEGFPRGSSSAEFMDAGPLAHIRLPDETPGVAYLRILNTMRPAMFEDGALLAGMRRSGETALDAFRRVSGDLGVLSFSDAGPLAHMRRPGETAYMAYRRVWGEWAARAAEERMGWSGALRRRHPLNPPEDLIPLYRRGS